MDGAAWPGAEQPRGVSVKPARSMSGACALCSAPWRSLPAHATRHAQSTREEPPSAAPGPTGNAAVAGRASTLHAIASSNHSSPRWVYHQTFRPAQQPSSEPEGDAHEQEKKGWGEFTETLHQADFFNL